MAHIIVQVYEIQDPREADQLIGLGVDHIGSVIPYEGRWLSPSVQEAIKRSADTPSKSSLIPLSTERDAVFRALDYYRPDIVHFCDAIPLSSLDRDQTSPILDRCMSMQLAVREAFPRIHIMRSIPIPIHCENFSGKDARPILDIARALESGSDYFLTDTMLGSGEDDCEKQPVSGFVGITGETCNWDIAKALIDAASIPVILAGGISPDNVFDAILGMKPAGVDSCMRTNAVDASGKPVRFKKDMEKVRRFVEETRRAERILGSLYTAT